MSEQKDWLKTFRALPLPLQVVGLGIGLLVLFVIYVKPGGKKTPDEPGNVEREPPRISAGAAGDYLFCFWNVENLFDDVDDPRRQPDEKYDNEFARDEKLRETKLRNLSSVLLAMNDGKGPDILAVAELESDRALELLQKRLNADLEEKTRELSHKNLEGVGVLLMQSNPLGLALGSAWIHPVPGPYTHRLFREQKIGRHIAPGILTRLPVAGDRTQQLGERHHRILEGHIEVYGKELVVVASHWTSRVARPGDKGEGKNEEGRKKYADVLYGRFKAMYLANPKVDFLVCGDFNDDPTDVSVVEHLHGTGDRSKLTAGGDPYLFNLSANRDPEKYGTLSYRNKWNLFDQILVSPGLLDDEGWTCDPATFRVERERMMNKKGKPWRFDEDDEGHRHYDKKFNGKRGYADHFPVTVRLKVK